MGIIRSIRAADPMNKVVAMIVMPVLFFASTAFAVTSLNQIKILNNEDFSLSFTGTIARDQIVTEYLNDIVQVSIKGVSIYPAKIIPIENGPVSKIFAYQYSPKLVRCRFSVRGKAEDFKGKFKVSPEGKSVFIKLSSSDPVIAPISEEDVDEKKLYEKVMKASVVKQDSDASIGDSQPIVQSQAQAIKIEEGTEKPQKVVQNQKSSPSFSIAFIKLGGVILLFLAMAMAIKKLKLSVPKNKNGLLGAINRFARGTLGKDGKMIEVVSTHYLDPKKSIAVVRVAGRLLVLGVANESINLITQLQDGVNGSFSGDSDESSQESMAFSDLFSTEKDKPTFGSSKPAPTLPGARSRIRNRLEGLKPL